jgi:hypothetical protein
VGAGIVGVKVGVDVTVGVRLEVALGAGSVRVGEAVALDAGASGDSLGVATGASGERVLVGRVGSVATAADVAVGEAVVDGDGEIFATGVGSGAPTAEKMR